MLCDWFCLLSLIEFALGTTGLPVPTVKFSRKNLLMLPGTVLPGQCSLGQCSPGQCSQGQCSQGQCSQDSALSLSLGQPQSHGLVFQVPYSSSLMFIFKALALALISLFPTFVLCLEARSETGTQPLWIQTLPPADDGGGHPV